MELMRDDLEQLSRKDAFKGTGLRDADFLRALADLADKLPTLKMYIHEDIKRRNMLVSKGTLRFVPGDWDNVYTNHENELGWPKNALKIFNIYKEFVEEMV